VRRVHDGVVRPGWQDTVTAQGLTYWETVLPDGSSTSYWREGEFYDFTAVEIAQLERDAATLFEMCVEAGDHMVAHPELMLRMGIPEYTHAQVIGTWNDEPSKQSVFGRFDVRYGGTSPQSRIDPTLRRPQLLEFNADTPTSLPETAYVQWEWFRDTGQGSDQWNSVFERLTRAWERNLGLIERDLRKDPVVYFACDGADRSGEDLFNTFLMRDACTQVRDGGRPRYATRSIMMNQITLDEATGAFFEGDPADGRHIDVLFKLYPWEWIVHEEFGRAAFADMARPGGTVWVEAPWKMLWSNKGLLPVLWQLFGTDPARSPLILPAYFADDDVPGWMQESHVRKPLLSREGANITIYEDGRTLASTGGGYGEEGYVLQSFAPLPDFPGPDGSHHPVLGIWMVDGEPAGLGIRESAGLITDNQSHFVPHVVGHGSPTQQGA
jgi:glutathionylspermidine synthase